MIDRDTQKVEMTCQVVGFVFLHLEVSASPDNLQSAVFILLS